jgi:hypothetical protein
LIYQLAVKSNLLNLPRYFQKSSKMIYLNHNAANQQINLTLNEGRTYFTEAFTHYLFILQYEDNTKTSNNRLAQVATIVSENERNTELTVTTVGLEYSGDYFYTVYGQNSASNTNPLNAAVVGEVEQGRAIILKDGEQPTYAATTSPEIIYHK